MDKAILTIIGVDRVGIVARVSTILSEHNANIINISQTNFEDLFTMVMVVELDKLKGSFSELKAALDQASQEIGVQINIQKEEIFRFMHRI